MPTETQELEQQLRYELATVKGFAIAKIVDQRSYDHAAETLTKIKTFRKNWSDYWTPKKDSAHKTWKMLCEAFNEGDKPAENAEFAVKRALLAWDDEQRRIQEELQREAQRKAEEEAEAERARQAFELEEAGASDADIESLIEAPVVVVAAPVQPTYQKASGVSRRDNWCMQITDLKALCKAIGAGKFKLSPEDSTKLIAFMESLLKPHAVADKTTLAIPGCKAVNRPTISGRV